MSITFWCAAAALSRVTPGIGLLASFCETAVSLHIVSAPLTTAGFLASPVAAADTFSHGDDVFKGIAGHVCALAVAAGIPALHCGAAQIEKHVIMIASGALCSPGCGCFCQFGCCVVWLLHACGCPWSDTDGDRVLLLKVHGLHVGSSQPDSNVVCPMQPH